MVGRALVLKPFAGLAQQHQPTPADARLPDRPRRFDDRCLVNRIEGRGVILEAKNDLPVRKIHTNVDAMIAATSEAVLDDVGDDFLEDELAVVPRARLQMPGIERPPQIRERADESRARSGEGQNVLAHRWPAKRCVARQDETAAIASDSLATTGTISLNET